MNYLDMEFIKPDAVQKRAYQVNIFESVKDVNSLIVLPTGLGKTVIALMVMAHRLRKGNILFLAPTKPLCEQHAKSIRKLMTVDDVAVVTGELYSPEKRKEVYRNARIIVATPQTVENDLDRGMNMGDFALIIFDEAHRAVGNYAYVGVARRYLRRGSQMLGMTASPGSDYKKLKEVADNLGIEHVELRTEHDEDVRPYISRRKMRWVVVDMPDDVKRTARKIDYMLDDFLSELKKYTKQAAHLSSRKLSKKVLIDIQRRMQGNLKSRGGTMYTAISVVSAAIKLAHLKDMLTSQGVEAAGRYIKKIETDRSKSAARIRNSEMYPQVRREILGSTGRKPKLEMTKKILREHLDSTTDGRVMIFAEYRDTIDFLISEIGTMEGVKAKRFIGQAKGTGSGMSQEEQKKTLDEFGEGKFNVLISTSIGEEGIDIPSTTLVLFYEPVPSAIRYIQRRGRTARDGMPGNVMILIMRGSRDEAYYWSSINKEKKMYSQIYKLKKELEAGMPRATERKVMIVDTDRKGQTKLDSFAG
ncbi:MAG: DEAD/DEAH box helicase family protein [Thermoplasmata archaeon]|nr:DEAD/DEAH box helicase family protein [Thermoplasmata archaeon]